MTRRLLVPVLCAAVASVAAAPSPKPAASPLPAASPAASSPAPAASAAPPPYTPASPDPVRGAALLKKAVEAHGGAAAIDSIRTLELTGTSGRTMAGQPPMEMASHTHMMLPAFYRNELMTQAGPIATLLNRDGGYVLVNGGGLPLPEAEATALRATANRNLMVLLRTRDAKEARVARVGSARLPEGEVEMVEFDVAGQKTVLGIDPATGLVRQAIYTMPIGGAASQVVATYSDYRALDNGAKYPFKSDGTVDGKPMFSSRLDKVIVNGPMEESLFALPSAPSEPADPLPWASPSPKGR
jgi:hypothetical protein